MILDRVVNLCVTSYVENYVVYETNFYRSLLPQILEVYVYFSSYSPFGADVFTWRLTKIDTYYKSAKKTFYYNNWVPFKRVEKLKKTGRVHFCSLLFR